MKIFSKILVGFVVGLGGWGAIHAQQELDSAIMKERLKKIYGDFVIKPAGDWQVSYQGKVHLWKWGSKGWVCPQDATIKCSDWVPLAFKWWSTKGFLDAWNAERRVGFDFGKPKAAAAAAAPSAIAANIPGTAAGPDIAPSPTPAPEAEVEADVFGGKKWALEIWDWKSLSGEAAKVYVSLRDQKIERIDTDDVSEYFDWKDKPAGGQSLSRVVMEKSGLRVVFSKLK